MIRSITIALGLFSLVFLCSLPVSAGSYKDPIVSDSLRRQYQGLPNRYAPKPSTSYKFKSRSYTSPLTGYSRYNYKFKSGGRTYKGRVETFPGGTTRHKGSWR